MKTQDVGYVQTARQAESARVERLRAGLHMLDAKPKNTHTLFVEDEEAVAGFDAAAALDTPKELLSRRFNRVRNAQLECGDVVRGGVDAGSKKARKDAERRKAAAYRQLAEAAEKEGKLRRAAEGMAHQKLLMGGGRKRKLRKDELLPGTSAKANVHKWKRERKR